MWKQLRREWIGGESSGGHGGSAILLFWGQKSLEGYRIIKLICCEQKYVFLSCIVKLNKTLKKPPLPNPF
jgi:hypothetical protein